MNSNIYNLSKNFKVFNDNNKTNQFKVLAKNTADSIVKPVEIKVNEIKKRILYNTEQEIHIDSFSKKGISLVPRDINQNLGDVIDDQININRNYDCIVFIQITYRWELQNHTNKFNINLFYNEKNYIFTTGWDSFSNRLNVYTSRIPLTFSPGDTIYFSVSTNNIPLLIEDFILTFEEI